MLIKWMTTPWLGDNFFLDDKDISIGICCLSSTHEKPRYRTVVQVVTDESVLVDVLLNNISFFVHKSKNVSSFGYDSIVLLLKSRYDRGSVKRRQELLNGTFFVSFVLFFSFLPTLVGLFFFFQRGTQTTKEFFLGATSDLVMMRFDSLYPWNPHCICFKVVLSQKFFPLPWDSLDVNKEQMEFVLHDVLDGLLAFLSVYEKNCVSQGFSKKPALDPSCIRRNVCCTKE